GASRASDAARQNRAWTRRSWVLLPFSCSGQFEPLYQDGAPCYGKRLLGQGDAKVTARRLRRVVVVRSDSAGPASSQARWAAESSSQGHPDASAGRSGPACRILPALCLRSPGPPTGPPPATGPRAVGCTSWALRVPSRIPSVRFPPPSRKFERPWIPII